MEQLAMLLKSKTRYEGNFKREPPEIQQWMTRCQKLFISDVGKLASIERGILNYSWTMLGSKHIKNTREKDQIIVDYSIKPMIC